MIENVRMLFYQIEYAIFYAVYVTLLWTLPTALNVGNASRLLRLISLPIFTLGFYLVLYWYCLKIKNLFEGV